MDNKVLYGVIAVLVIAVVACVAYIAFDDGSYNNGGNDTPDIPDVPDTTTIQSVPYTDTSYNTKLDYAIVTANGGLMSLDNPVTFKGEVTIRVTVYSDRPILSVSVSVDDGKVRNLTETASVDISFTNNVSDRFYAKSEFLITADNDVTVTAVPHFGTVSGNDRFLAVDVEEGIHVRLNGQVVTSTSTDMPMVLEIVSDEPRSFAVIVEEAINDYQFQTVAYDDTGGEATTSMYISIPESTRDGYYGYIRVAYSEPGENTPSYTLSLPDCYDPAHPDTVVTYYLNDEKVEPGVITLTDFATLYAKVDSTEKISMYRTSTTGYFDRDSAGTIGYNFTDNGSFQVNLANYDSVLSWLEGDLSVSMAFCYVDEAHQDMVGESEVTVTYPEDDLVLRYGSMSVGSGDTVDIDLRDFQVSLKDSSGSGTVYYSSTWSGEEVSVWMSGMFHIEGNESYTIPGFNLDFESHVVAEIQVNYVSD